MKNVFQKSDSLLSDLNSLTNETMNKENNVGKLLYDENIINDLKQTLKQVNELTSILIDQLKNDGINVDANVFLKLFLFFYFSHLFCHNLFSESNDPIRGKNGMVVSASELASKVGIEILKKGGNAVDAAVAVGFALAVTYPSAGNIGGGGFMVIHLSNGTNTTIDYREKAPFAATELLYQDSLGNFLPEKSQFGVTSSGVPGSVAGFNICA